MSASRNPDAVANQEGQFGSRVPRDEPMTTHGHKPGVLASESDRAPEFSAQTYPPGTAPRDRTFVPNANNEAPPLKDYSQDVDEDADRATAQDSLPGVTSADVHKGLGHPGQGMTSKELHHDGQGGRHKNPSDLMSQAPSGAPASGLNQVDPRDPLFHQQRALDRDEAQPGPHRGGYGGPAAEERQPATSEELAQEMPSGKGRDRGAI